MNENNRLAVLGAGHVGPVIARLAISTATASRYFVCSWIVCRVW